jgi:hypothetical protein
MGLEEVQGTSLATAYLHISTESCNSPVCERYFGHFIASASLLWTTHTGHKMQRPTARALHSFQEHAPSHCTSRYSPP